MKKGSVLDITARTDTYSSKKDAKFIQVLIYFVNESFFAYFIKNSLHWVNMFVLNVLALH